MADISRRTFMGLSLKLAVMMGLGVSAAPRIAECLDELSKGAAPVLWLQGQSCSGCSVSFLNAEEPGPAAILTESISLLYHSTLSAATGSVATGLLGEVIKKGGYILVVEGSIPAGMEEACVIGDEPFARQVSRAAKNAAALVALGACASYGGIPAAENNPTGAMGAPQFLEKENIHLPYMILPGCPAHPDWLVGALTHTLKFGIPPLDEEKRPKMFFSKFLHEQCPRFADYERENFAETFDDDGCLFKLGCLGPNTHADCTIRNWNSGVNSCIRAGAPCIGCASSAFPGKIAFPFYRKSERKV